MKKPKKKINNEDCKVLDEYEKQVHKQSKKTKQHT